MKKIPYFIFLVIFMAISYSTIAQQAPPRGSQPQTGRQFISTTDFDNLPQDQKIIMLANVDKFSVEGISAQVIPQSTFNLLLPNRQANILANPQLYRVVNANPSIIISSIDFDKMPHEERAHILVNLDLYSIKDDSSTSTSSTPTSGKLQVTSNELGNSSAEKQAYIVAHPDLYEIVD